MSRPATAPDEPTESEDRLDEPDADFEQRLAEPDAFELVTEMAHDIRSPLNSILFLSEVLRSGRSGPMSDHQRSQLGLIYSASLGIISVVNDIMELASDRHGKSPDEPIPFSIARVFESVEQMVRPMAEEKGLTLSFVRPEQDQWHGHPGRIGRVILNLTTNALKFTDKGGVDVEARRIGSERVLFSVSDTGRGITDHDLQRLFHPFQKSDARAGHFFSASGLGLSIAKRLVASMGSELEVQTERGRGTRFDFMLNLRAVRT